MDNIKYNEFVTKLIGKTINGSIMWRELCGPTLKSDNPHLYELIDSANEFEFIRVSDSYSTECEQGNIYLIHEIVTECSEEDDGDYYSLLIQSNNEAPLIKILSKHNQKELTRLKNAIQNKFNKLIEIEAFINGFLSNQ